eukprot:GILI01003800.1.p1 GENE.GILI01003800.1~~GILI01003800.1.p1  ORF type:complete len:489 (-),score=125.68 GILI01003800.1:279-1745(-)
MSANVGWALLIICSAAMLSVASADPGILTALGRFKWTKESCQDCLAIAYRADMKKRGFHDYHWLRNTPCDYLVRESSQRYTQCAQLQMLIEERKTDFSKGPYKSCLSISRKQCAPYISSLYGGKCEEPQMPNEYDDCLFVDQWLHPMVEILPMQCNKLCFPHEDPLDCSLQSCLTCHWLMQYNEDFEGSPRACEVYENEEMQERVESIIDSNQPLSSKRLIRCQTIRHLMRTSIQERVGLIQGCKDIMGCCPSKEVALELTKNDERGIQAYGSMYDQLAQAEVEGLSDKMKRESSSSSSSSSSGEDGYSEVETVEDEDAIMSVGGHLGSPTTASKRKDFESDSPALKKQDVEAAPQISDVDSQLYSDVDLSSIPIKIGKHRWDKNRWRSAAPIPPQESPDSSSESEDDHWDDEDSVGVEEHGTVGDEADLSTSRVKIGNHRWNAGQWVSEPLPDELDEPSVVRIRAGDEDDDGIPVEPSSLEYISLDD